MTLRLLINASNLRQGGVVQVGTSAIAEMARLAPKGCEIAVLASEAVDRNLRQIGFEAAAFARYRSRDVLGFAPRDPVLTQEIAWADAVFTVFGPLYSLRRPKVSVVGFAQPWIIYPENDIYAGYSRVEKLKSRFKYGVQGAILRRNTDHVIAEADHVKDRLVGLGFFPETAVSVVSNCVSDIFRRPELWRPVDLPAAEGLRIGFLGRDYPHKNLSILPETRRILRETHGIAVDFVVTMNEAEWQARPPEFRAAVLNAGTLDVSQCPAFYEGLDAVIFPSLLECFSVTPLEALAMGKPLFASDRPFVRDICGDFATYFNPLSPAAAAAAIARGLAAPPDPARIEAARRHGFGGAGARERASRYLDILIEKTGRR